MSEFLQIGRDVHRFLGTAVNAADTAGRKDADSCQVGDQHRRGNRCRRRLFVDQIDSHISSGSLGNVLALAHQFQLITAQTDFQFAVDDRHGSRNGPFASDDLFDLMGEFNVFRIRHAMGEDRRFQSDDRLVFSDRFLDFRSDR